MPDLLPRLRGLPSQTVIQGQLLADAEAVLRIHAYKFIAIIPKLAATLAEGPEPAKQIAGDRVIGHIGGELECAAAQELVVEIHPGELPVKTEGQAVAASDPAQIVAQREVVAGEA